MKYKMIRKGFGKTLLSVIFSSFVATLAATATNNIPQVQHVIIVVQENRTPDNLFNQDSTLHNAGGDVVPPGNQGYCGSNTVNLMPTPLYTCWDPDHTHGKTDYTGAWWVTWDNGNMDGACKVTIVCPHNDCNTYCTNDQSLCYNSQWQNCPYTYVANSAWSTEEPYDTILNPYFQLANQYGFANRMFQTNQGPSFPAHQFLFSGTSAPVYPTDQAYCHYDTNDKLFCYQWFDAENIGIQNQTRYGCIADSGAMVYQIDPNYPYDNEYYAYQPPDPKNAPYGFPCYDHATLSDLLDGASPQISWKYYARSDTDLWTAPNAIDHICMPTGMGGNCSGPAFTNEGPLQPNVVLPSYVPPPYETGDAAPILTDIESCALAQVSWVIPDGNWSDHSNYYGIHQGHGGDGGPSWVAAIVNAVGNSQCKDNGVSYWNDTVILVTWDDWGGYYDHVSPAKSGGGPGIGYPNGSGKQYVYGFRVSLLAISAYAVQTGPPGAQYTGYVSTTTHDFGSILNFIEWAFGSGGQFLGGPYGISDNEKTPYADYFAPDTLTGGGPYNYGLYDFFTYSNQNPTPIPFRQVQGAKYKEICFHNPYYYDPTTTCFSQYPLDPDNDANE